MPVGRAVSAPGCEPGRSTWPKLHADEIRGGNPLGLHSIAASSLKLPDRLPFLSRTKLDAIRWAFHQVEPSISSWILPVRFRHLPFPVPYSGRCDSRWPSHHALILKEPVKR